jgi:hypothetical protein
MKLNKIRKRINFLPYKFYLFHFYFNNWNMDVMFYLIYIMGTPLTTVDVAVDVI